MRAFASKGRKTLAGIAVAVEFLGVWALVYGSLLIPGLILIILGLLILTAVLVKHPPRASDHAASNWIFDRPEKRRWEDVDRVLRR